MVNFRDVLVLKGTRNMNMPLLSMFDVAIYHFSLPLCGTISDIGSLGGFHHPFYESNLPKYG